MKIEQEPKITGTRRLLQWLWPNTFGAAVTWCVACAIVLSGLTAGYYAFRVVYQNKKVDTWAIMFLELEQQSHRLRNRLRDIDTANRLAQDGSFGRDGKTLRVNSPSHLQPLHGPLPADIRPSDFGFDNAIPASLAKLSVVEFAGEKYLARLIKQGQEDRLKLKKIAPNLFNDILGQRFLDEATVYLITREGRLLYVNREAQGLITPLTFVDRPLVQSFISSPISHGQMELGNIYGFFMEIPDSNMILFSEVDKKAALAGVTRAAKRFLLVLGVIVTLVLVIIQFPLGQLLLPLRELVTLTRVVGQGNFSVKLRHSGLGEISHVAQQFNSMLQNLISRDQAIMKLMEENAEKVRLTAELKVAEGVQTNLLPKVSLPKKSGLEISTRYLPASECGGDWYGYHYHEMADETVVAIADVSGHGAGASMFTAVIAGLFATYQSRLEQKQEPWPLQEFAAELNRVIWKLGQGDWHATMLMARFATKKKELELLCAGHMPPIVFYPDKGNAPEQTPGLKSRRICLSSDVLGLAPVCAPKSHLLPFPEGAQLLLFTDGLTEVKSASGRAYGGKKIFRAFIEHGHQSPRVVVGEILSGWQKHQGSTPPQDDVCVIAMRAA